MGTSLILFRANTPRFLSSAGKISRRDTKSRDEHVKIHTPKHPTSEILRALTAHQP